MSRQIGVMHSLISVDAVLEYLNYYNIGNLIECRFLTKGLNDSYLVVTSMGKYVFRIYRNGWRSYSDILYELEAINFLHNKVILVSTPVRKADGFLTNEFFAPEGTRYAVLFTYAEGMIPSINKENSFLLGKSLARIHEAGAAFFPRSDRSFELNIRYLIEEPMKLINPMVEKVVEIDKMKFINEFVDELKCKLSIDSLEVGFCHGDFHDFNVHIHRGEPTVFDFDCSSYGYLAYDISVYLWNLKNNYWEKEKECWSAFMDGYKSMRNLSEAEIAAIQYFVPIRRIWLMWIYLKNPDVFGTNWINRKNLMNFIDDLKNDKKSLYEI